MFASQAGTRVLYTTLYVDNATHHADEPAGDGELELVGLGEEGGDAGEDGHALHVPLRVLLGFRWVGGIGFGLWLVATDRRTDVEAKASKQAANRHASMHLCLHTHLGDDPGADLDAVPKLQHALQNGPARHAACFGVVLGLGLVFLGRRCRG